MKSYQFPPIVSQQLRSYSLQAGATSRDKVNQLGCIALLLFVLTFRHVRHYYCCGVHGRHTHWPDGILFVSLFIVSLAKKARCELPAESDAWLWLPKRPRTRQLWRGGLTGQFNTWLKVEVTTPWVPFVMSQRLCFQAGSDFLKV